MTAASHAHRKDSLMFRVQSETWRTFRNNQIQVTVCSAEFNCKMQIFDVGLGKEQNCYAPDRFVKFCQRSVNEICAFLGFDAK